MLHPHLCVPGALPGPGTYRPSAGPGLQHRVLNREQSSEKQSTWFTHIAGNVGTAHMHISATAVSKCDVSRRQCVRAA